MAPVPPALDDDELVERMNNHNVLIFEVESKYAKSGEVSGLQQPRSVTRQQEQKYRLEDVFTNDPDKVADANWNVFPDCRGHHMTSCANACRKSRACRDFIHRGGRSSSITSSACSQQGMSTGCSERMG